MKIVWSPEKIENYKRASEYTAFHRKLSVLAEPYLEPQWTLVDLGCGPGLMDLRIAPMVSRIDAIDSEPIVIEDLKTRLDDVFRTDSATAEKIFPRLAAPGALSGGRWDVVMLCFQRITEKLLDLSLSLAEHRALVFMYGRAETAPLAFAEADEKESERFSVADMEAYLAEKNYAFKKNVMEMQFGQPFRTIEDIHAFLSECGGHTEREIECIDLSAADAFDEAAIKRMAVAEERIIKTNRFDYPYYLPKSISVALFVILTNR